MILSSAASGPVPRWKVWRPWCVGFLGEAQRGSHTPPRPGATTKAAWDGGRDGAWRRLAAVGLHRSVCASLLSGVREKKPPRLQSCQKRRRPLLPSEPVSRKRCACACELTQRDQPRRRRGRERRVRRGRGGARCGSPTRTHARARPCHTPRLAASLIFTHGHRSRLCARRECGSCCFGLSGGRDERRLAAEDRALPPRQEPRHRLLWQSQTCVAALALTTSRCSY